MDILLTMRVKADNTTKKVMKDMRADRVLPSISGTLICKLWLNMYMKFCKRLLTNFD